MFEAVITRLKQLISIKSPKYKKNTMDNLQLAAFTGTSRVYSKKKYSEPGILQ